MAICTHIHNVSRGNKFSSGFKFLGILLLVLLVSGKSWGAIATSTFTNKDFAVGSGEPVWVNAGATTTAFESASPSRGVQTTLTNIKASGLSLTNTTFSANSITQIKMILSSNGTGGTVSSITVGGNNLKYNGSTNSVAVANSDNATYTFSTAMGYTGNIIITFTSTATTKSLYIKSIEVTYTTTSVSAPITQATSINFTSIGQTGMTANWTNGDGAKRVVLMNTSNSFTAPTDGTDPTANTAYSGSGEQVVFNGTGTSVPVTGLITSSTYYYRVYEYNGSGATTKYLTSAGTNNPNSQITTAASSPTITTTGTINAFANTAINTSSSEQNYTVQGANLTGGITITPPAGFEISKTSGSGFIANPSTLTFTSSEVASAQNVYVRFSPTFAQTYSGYITHTSTGATQVDKALSGTGVNQEPTNHATSFTATTNSSSQITITWTDANGGQAPAGYLVKASTGTPTTPIDGTAEVDATLVKNIAQGTQTAIFTGLSASTTYNFSIWPYTNSSASINYKTDAVVPTVNATTSASLLPTVLQAGDIAILQLNSTNPDRLAFITFVDLNPNTVINFTDNGFASSTTVRTGEGFLTYTAPTTIVAGSVITWYNGMTITGTGWNSASPSNFALASPDQLFAYQGTWDNSQILIYGVSTTPWITTGSATSNNSYLPAGLTDNLNAFSFASTASNAFYSGTSTGTIGALKSFITNSSNWVSSASDQGAQTWTFSLGNSTVLNYNSVANSLTVNTGESLTITAGKQLTVTGIFTNNGTINLLSNTTGTATILTPASIGGGGTATVQQYLTAGRNWYLSMPISSANVEAFNTATSVSIWNELIGDWATISAGSAINPLTGYISVATNSDGPITFSGSLNNGDQSVNVTRTAGVTKEGFNLIGNPYPSYLNPCSLITSLTKLEPTIWYRTKNASYTFETVNTSSGIGTNVGNNASGPVTGYVPPMQAFWVRVQPNIDPLANNSETLTFTNAMRSHASTGNVLLKSRAVTDNQLVRLQVSNGVNNDETVLYSNPNAQNGLDAYDSQKMTNGISSIPEIYTLADSKELVINGMNSIALDTEIPLGFRSGKIGDNFSIKSTELLNFDSNVHVMLKDSKQIGEVEITNGLAYNFSTTDTVATTSRFSIIFRSAGTTTDTNKTANNKGIIITRNASNQIIIRYADNLTGEGSTTVYNAIGQKIVSKQLNSNVTVLNDIKTAGVYIVTVNIAGKTSTQKIIID